MDKRIKKMYKFLHGYKLSIRWIFPIFVIILLLSYFGNEYIRSLAYKNIYNNITELGEQIATQLNQTITEQKRFVEIMGNSINNGYFKTQEQFFDYYAETLQDYHFTRLVILDEKGNGTTSDRINITNYPNIEEFLNQDDVYVSANRPSIVSDNQVNVYSKTVRLNRKKHVTMGNN